jgi:hypothetical protein
MRIRIVHAAGVPFWLALWGWTQNATIHVLRGLAYRLGLLRARSPLVFCIGIQRTGTTSFGDFCQETLRLKRRGYEMSSLNDWTRHWMNGDYERIFASADFRTGEVFEDDPWWCPQFYEVLAARFPQAKFVLITRDQDKWFKSLTTHSGGRSLGDTDIHARVYKREREFEALKSSGASRRRIGWQGLELAGHEEHYKACYQEHTDNVLAFFAKEPADRFLHIELEDPDKWRKVAKFLGYADRPYADTHSNWSVTRPDAASGKADAGSAASLPSAEPPLQPTQLARH